MAIKNFHNHLTHQTTMEVSSFDLRLVDLSGISESAFLGGLPNVAGGLFNQFNPGFSDLSIRPSSLFTA